MGRWLFFSERDGYMFVIEADGANKAFYKAIETYGYQVLDMYYIEIK